MVEITRQKAKECSIPEEMEDLFDIADKAMGLTPKSKTISSKKWL